MSPTTLPGGPPADGGAEALITEPRAARFPRVRSGRLRAGDLRRAAHAMVVARAVAVPWALLIVLGHELPPYPPGVEGAALGAVALLAAGDLVVWLVLHHRRSRRWLVTAALGGLLLDLAAWG